MEMNTHSESLINQSNVSETLHERRTNRSRLSMYYEILRINHWFKNVFVALGSVAAMAFYHEVSPSPAVIGQALAVLVASCLLSSVNYIINGIVDKPYDAKHPRKKHRAIPMGLIHLPELVLTGLVVLGFSLLISIIWLNERCLIMLLLFLAAGIIYNIRPIRTKDLPYLDVVSEAANNPIRLLLGWFAVSPDQSPPPLSLGLLFWVFGCFLMTAKRYAEFNYLKEDSVRFRITFKYYSRKSLFIAMCIYIFFTLALFIQFSVGFHPLLLYSLPGIILFIIWFMVLTEQEDSIVKDPERLYRKKAFFVYSLCLTAILLILSLTQP